MASEGVAHGASGEHASPHAERALQISIEQLERELRARLEAVPEALALCTHLVTNSGERIEATNDAERMLARAQFAFDAVSGLREVYEAKTKEAVVDIETARTLRALVLLQQTAQQQVKLYECLVDGRNHFHKKVSRLQDMLTRMPPAANDDNYATVA